MELRNLFSFRDDPEEGAVKPFLEHLEDLRVMVIKGGIVLGIAMIVCFLFRMQLVKIMQWPLTSIDPKLMASLQSLGVPDSMTITLQMAFYAGIVISFPILLYFIAEFGLPALTKKERKMVLPTIGAGFGLFLSGVLFCYFIVLPKTLAFFFSDAKDLGWMPTWTVHEYYSFVTQFTVAFGLSFELPIVVLLLVKLGIVNRSMLAKMRSYAIVIIFIFAAVITPTQDVLTLCFMAVPMVVLYEACIWIAAFMGRKEEPIPVDPVVSIENHSGSTEEKEDT